jgi:hypothetical protein
MRGSGLSAGAVRTWLRKSFQVGVMAVLGLLALVPAARAQGLESVLSPGKLSQAHAKWEGDCKACHVRFDRNAQDKLCMDCHKDTVGQDIRAKTGLHGRMKPAQCRTCHTEHRGLNGRIVELDEKRFDHSVADFALRGKHQQVQCAKCHEPGKKRRTTPQDCVACHKKDDKHKGSLGPKCADCHTEISWKERRFDHDKTRFPLTGRHIDTKCDSCHRNGQYRDTPRDCYSCHKKDDEKFGHQGQFGTKCESCHVTDRWDLQTFDHDKDTDYELRGKHRNTECTACHTGPLYAVKLSQACFDCHKKDDKHRESLGRECGNCHTERSWNEPAKFDHDRTRFPLRGGHANPRITCESCHKNLSSMRNTPRDCYSCHSKNDKHDGQQGRQCEQCHNDKAWKIQTFDHNRTRFPLTGRHAATACKDCHKTLRFKDVKSECYACHQKDDKHKKKFGPKCESCHSTRAWAIWNFDHNKRSNYKLDATHAKVACENCHRNEAPTGANVAPLGSTCVSCHRKDDAHDGAFGTRCESCHTSESWKKTTRLRTSGSPFEHQEVSDASVVLGQASYFNRFASSGLAKRWLQ